MIFASENLLWLLLLVPLVAGLGLLGVRRRQQRLEAFGAWTQVQRLLAGAYLGVHRVRIVLLSVGTACLVLALARPQFGQVEETVLARGVDVMIAVDVSTSMLATDIPPTRLVRAQQQLSDLITRLSGHRIGIIAFAGSAVLQCPLTLDQTILHQTMTIVDQHAVGAQGTNLADAVRVAIQSFDEDSPRHRVLVLLTDGEDHEGELDAAAREAAEAQVMILGIGIGRSEGSPVPQMNATGQTVGFVQAPDGSPVLTRLQRMGLLTLASATDGEAYETSSLGNSEIDLIARRIQALPQRDIEEQRVTHREEQFQILLLPAILFLLADLLLLSGRPPRRRTLAEAATPMRAGRRAGQAAAIGLLLLLSVRPVRADEGDSPEPEDDLRAAAHENNVGVAAHREGALEEALEHYQQAEVAAPGTPQVDLNIGTLRYQQGDLEEAESRFEQAAETEDSSLRGTAQFNLGTTHLQQAREAADGGDLQQAIAAADRSVVALRRSLLADSSDWDAKFNLELAMALRDRWQQQLDQQRQQEEEEERQDQSQQQDQGQNQQQTPQQDQQQDQSQNQSQQDQNPQDQDQQSDDQQSNSGQPDQQPSDQGQQQDQQQGQPQDQQPEDQQSQDQGEQRSPPNEPQDQDGEDAQPEVLSPEELAEAAQRDQAEAVLDLVPFQEYPYGMRNLMGMQAPEQSHGPSW